MLRTLFTTLVLVFVLVTQGTPALASCRYDTYFLNGRMVQCTTCCYGSLCSTQCF